MSDAPYSVLRALEGVRGRGKPPIHLWNPEVVKDIDMTIESDGSWTYLGTPIGRQRLSHLFASVLRREDDGEFYVVTPVEKCRVTVRDAPFTAILLAVEGKGEHQILRFTTNMADEVCLDSEHPIRLSSQDSGAQVPYVMVRNGLEAKLTRSVYYQMMDLVVGHQSLLGVWSSGSFFPLSED